MADNKGPTVEERVAKMPQWLKRWYESARKIVGNVLPDEEADDLTLKLAVNEYKRAQANKKVYGDALEMIMQATETFEFGLGKNKEHTVQVHPADGSGVLHLTVSTQRGSSEK
jgi:hypothetical protein